MHTNLLSAPIEWDKESRSDRCRPDAGDSCQPVAGLSDVAYENCEDIDHVESDWDLEVDAQNGIGTAAEVALDGALHSAGDGVGLPLPGSCQSLEWRIVQHELLFPQCHPYLPRPEHVLDDESRERVELGPAENPARLVVQIAGADGSAMAEAAEGLGRRNLKPSWSEEIYDPCIEVSYAQGKKQNCRLTGIPAISAKFLITYARTSLRKSSQIYFSGKSATPSSVRESSSNDLLRLRARFRKSASLGASCLAPGRRLSRRSSRSDGNKSSRSSSLECFPLDEADIYA